MTCPLCQTHFEKDEMACHSGCPLHRACKVICCPHCRYSFVEESTLVNLVKRVSSAVGRLNQKGTT